MNVGLVIFGVLQIALGLFVIWSVLDRRSFIRRRLARRTMPVNPPAVTILRETWPWWKRLMALFVIALLAWFGFFLLIVILKR